MDYEEAEKIVADVREEAKEQAEGANIFLGLEKAIYTKDEGTRDEAEALKGKMSGAHPGYAIDLALQIQQFIEQKLSQLYKLASRFKSKKIRNALYKLITRDVYQPIELAKDTYNSKTKSREFQMEVSKKISKYQNVRYGI
jgi:hypothetical protein